MQNKSQHQKHSTICRKNAETSYSFIFQKSFPNLFLFNIYRQKTTKLSYRECIHGIIINILRLSFEGNTIYELTFTNLYIYTKHTHLSNKVDFGIGQNDFPFSTVNSLDSCWGKDSEHIFAAWEYKTAK